mmetsp:Transcript_1227/g.2616  ORF Transcript_1227/g.2616 Transcript_1227/m.2616 type:complete len:582 (-) Transcript_1227:57-1802(-)
MMVGSIEKETSEYSPLKRFLYGGCCLLLGACLCFSIYMKVNDDKAGAAVGAVSTASLAFGPHYVVDQKTLRWMTEKSRRDQMYSKAVPEVIEAPWRNDTKEAISKFYIRRAEEKERVNSVTKKRIEAQRETRHHFFFIPYRDRLANLKIFEEYMAVYLSEYGEKNKFHVIVVEQADQELFNRGKLVNIAIQYAKKLPGFLNSSCGTVHDVDMLPFPGTDYISCEKVRHMSYRLQTNQWRTVYSGYFGGVTALSIQNWTSMNGFSNLFVGWGREDDNLLDRAMLSKSIPDREAYLHNNEHGGERRFMNIHGSSDPRAPKNDANKELQQRLKHDKKNYTKEGLNSLDYQILSSKNYKAKVTRFGGEHELDVHFLSVNWTYPGKDQAEILERHQNVLKEQKLKEDQIMAKLDSDLKRKDPLLHNLAQMVNTGTEKHRVIIVPFQKELRMLNVFLEYMILFLGRFGKNNIFHLVVVEQANSKKFNRGVLANVGLDYAPRAIEQLDDSSCAVVHDKNLAPFPGVDYLSCSEPRSIARFKQTTAFRPTPDVKSFEGVASLSFASWRKINGYSTKLKIKVVKNAPILW